MSDPHSPLKNTWLPLAFIAVAILALSAELSVSGLSLAELARSAYQSAANVVAISAGIPSNEYNTIVAQIDAKEKELNARETALVAREGGVSTATGNNPLAFYALGAVTALLFVLLLLNFYFDWKRGLLTRTQKEGDIPATNARTPHFGAHHGEYSTHLGPST
jgi:hypothetical protein